MNLFTKISLALIISAFVASTPVIAAETGTLQKPDLGATLKDKAADVVDNAKTKVDNSADSLEKKIGKKDVIDNTRQKVDNTADNLKKSLGAKDEVLNVEQNTVTVETPSGVAQETTTTITPEKIIPPAK